MNAAARFQRTVFGLAVGGIIAIGVLQVVQIRVDLDSHQHEIGGVLATENVRLKTEIAELREQLAECRQ